MRQAFKKKNTKTIFTSGSNSADTRQKLLPNSYPGIYELKCTCNSTEFGQTKKDIDKVHRTPTPRSRENGTILQQKAYLIGCKNLRNIPYHQGFLYVLLAAFVFKIKIRFLIC